MKTLIKHASWREALLDPPQPMTKDERMAQRGRELPGALLGGLAGAGAGALLSHQTDGGIKPGMIATGAGMGGIGGLEVGSLLGSKKVLNMRQDQPLDEERALAEDKMKSQRFDPDMVGRAQKNMLTFESGTRPEGSS